MWNPNLKSHSWLLQKLLSLIYRRIGTNSLWRFPNIPKSDSGLWEIENWFEAPKHGTEHTQDTFELQLSSSVPLTLLFLFFLQIQSDSEIKLLSQGRTPCSLSIWGFHVYGAVWSCSGHHVIHTRSPQHGLGFSCCSHHVPYILNCWTRTWHQNSHW